MTTLTFRRESRCFLPLDEATAMVSLAATKQKALPGFGLTEKQLMDVMFLHCGSGGSRVVIEPAPARKHTADADGY